MVPLRNHLNNNFPTLRKKWQWQTHNSLILFTLIFWFKCHFTWDMKKALCLAEIVKKGLVGKHGMEMVSDEAKPNQRPNPFGTISNARCGFFFARCYAVRIGCD